MFSLEHKVNILLRYVICDDPVDKAELKALAAEALQFKTEENNKGRARNAEDLIVNMLDDIGIGVERKGYDLIVYALERAIKDPSVLDSIHKELYYDIAKVYGISATNVERRMRDCIETSFMNMDWRDIARIYGNNVSPKKAKLTNRQFLCFWTKELTREMKRRKIDI